MARRLFLSFLIVSCISISAAEGAAVSVSQGGVGDALVYGYYNVRSGNVNLFSVVNTAATYGVRANVTFNDAVSGSALKTFDVCLAPHDIWLALISISNGRVLLSKVDEAAIDPGSGAGPFPAAGIDLGTTGEGFFTVIAKNAITGMISGQNCGTDISEDAGNVLTGQHYLYLASTGNFVSYGATAIKDLYSGSVLSPNLNHASAVLSRSAFSVWHVLPDVSNSGTELIVTFPLGTGAGGSLNAYDTEGNLKSTTLISLPNAVNVLTIGGSADIFSSGVVSNLSVQNAPLGQLSLEFSSAVPATGFVMHNILGLRTLLPLP